MIPRAALAIAGTLVLAGLTVGAGAALAVETTPPGATAEAAGATSKYDDVVFSPATEASLASLPAAQYEGLKRSAHAEPVLAAFARLDGFEDGGYSDGTTSDGILIRWHGAVTDEARAVVTRFEAQGFVITIDRVPKTHKQGKALIRDVAIALDSADIGHDGIGLSVDGRTFEVFVLQEVDLAEATRITDGIVSGLDVSVQFRPFDMSYDQADVVHTEDGDFAPGSFAVLTKD